MQVVRRRRMAEISRHAGRGVQARANSRNSCLVGCALGHLLHDASKTLLGHIGKACIH